MPRKKTFTVDAALAGALEVFAERGYHGTSIEAIARHLKLSRSSLYATFRGKLALFVQVLQRYSGANSLPGLTELRDAGAPRAALAGIFEMAAASREKQQPHVLNLIEAALGLSHRDPEIGQLVDEVFQNLEGLFRGAVERGQAAAEIAAHVDPITVARVLVSLYFGLYVIARHDGAGEQQRAVLQQVAALLPAP